MPIEKAPRNPVPRYVASTPGRKEYHVQTGDTWDTIARDNGLTARALIQANFRTRDPAEVNWYLHNYVGCQRLTHDRLNYVFSTSDSPGIIFIPQTGPIHYSVPMVAQFQNPICWVASVAMIASYKGRLTQGLAPFTGGFDPVNSSIPNPYNNNLGWVEYYRLLTQFGFVCENPFPDQQPDPAYIEDLLRAHGPWMLTHIAADLLPGVAPNAGGHAVVITGIDVAAGVVWFNNPWGNKDQVTTVNTILFSMERLQSQRVRSVCYIP